MDFEGAAARPQLEQVAAEPMPLVSFRCPSTRYTCRLIPGSRSRNHSNGPSQPPMKVDSVSGLQRTRAFTLSGWRSVNAREMAHPMQLPTSATFSSPRELTNSSSMAT